MSYRNEIEEEIVDIHSQSHTSSSSIPRPPPPPPPPPLTNASSSGRLNSVKNPPVKTEKREEQMEDCDVILDRNTFLPNLCKKGLRNNPVWSSFNPLPKTCFTSKQQPTPDTSRSHQEIDDKRPQEIETREFGQMYRSNSPDGTIEEKRVQQIRVTRHPGRSRDVVRESYQRKMITRDQLETVDEKFPGDYLDNRVLTPSLYKKLSQSSLGKPSMEKLPSWGEIRKQSPGRHQEKSKYGEEFGGRNIPSYRGKTNLIPNSKCSTSSSHHSGKDSIEFTKSDIYDEEHSGRNVPSHTSTNYSKPISKSSTDGYSQIPLSSCQSGTFDTDLKTNPESVSWATSKNKSTAKPKDVSRILNDNCLMPTLMKQLAEEYDIPGWYKDKYTHRKNHQGEYLERRGEYRSFRIQKKYDDLDNNDEEDMTPPPPPPPERYSSGKFVQRSLNSHQKTEDFNQESDVCREKILFPSRNLFEKEPLGKIRGYDCYEKIASENSEIDLGRDLVASSVKQRNQRPRARDVSRRPSVGYEVAYSILKQEKPCLKILYRNILKRVECE